MSDAIREAALAARILALLHEDQSKASQTMARIGHNRGPPSFDEPVTYNVPEFCNAHKISRSTLYGLWAANLGPKFFKVGSAVRISRESAAAWRAEREAATDQRLGQNGEAA